ncbi:MAG: toxin [Proteobacteria bacterium SG_bin5]|nr:MAG: toxin [Proteobacteria bacterium SG_bin5]
MFEFDPEKSATNKAKHGIDFVEAQRLWEDRNARYGRVIRVGLTEQRWLVVGRIDDRLWTAVVTYRGEATRIISVRRAREDEARHYDETD